MKILQSEITGTQTKFSTNIGGKLSFILSLLSPSAIPLLLLLQQIFSMLPNCTTTIISLEPCALNA
jgi:hypothetical protein